MARKKHYLQISNKDINVYRLLNNCCHSTREQLKYFATENRIKSYLKEKLIQELKTHSGTYYRLTQKGYKEFEKSFERENYKYVSQSPEHDVMLSQKYIDTYKATDGNFKWLNETDLKQLRESQLDELRARGEWERAEILRTASITDCIIQTDVTIAYDVITDNYSKATIELKEQYAQALQIKLETQKI